MPQDEKEVSGHEPPPPMPPPPPRPLWPALGAVVFDAAALIAVFVDRCDLAKILLILALLFGGYVVLRLAMSTESSDEKNVGGHEPPPP